jgi:S1-C subfamily serine protease
MPNNKMQMSIIATDTSETRIIRQLTNDINQLHNDVSQIKLHDTAYLSELYDELHKNEFNIYDIVKNSCSTVYFSFEPDTQQTASGSFITLDNNDLQYGLFMTAAHCVMKVDGTNVLTVNELYVTNPITGNFTRVNLSKIYYDGIANVALIRTDIDFSDYSSYPLQLSPDTPRTGDDCFVCGNPKGKDHASLSKGVIRDARYYDNGGKQIPQSLHITASAIIGNEGSIIANINGQIIGVFSFALGSGFETLGGGVNLSVLNSTLPVLKTQAINGSSNHRNTSKYYMGLSYGNFWTTSSRLSGYYGYTDTFPNQGVIIDTQPPDISPFNGVIEKDDLLLSATIDGQEYKFGDLIDQYPPGIMVYTPVSPNITIKYIDYSDSYIEKTAPITLVTYASLGPSYAYLDTSDASMDM